MNDEPMSTEVSSDDRLWAALSYVFSPVVPIVLMLWEDKKNRPFIRAHNAQALVLGIIATILYITVVVSCVGFLVFIYQLYCAYKAYQGEMVEIPVVTNLVKNQGWA